MNQDQYRQGFVQQCSVRGVDPGWLVKQSQGVLDQMSGVGKLTGKYQGPAPSLKAIPQGNLDSPFPSRGSNNPRSPGPLPPPTSMPPYNADREAAYQHYMKSAPQPHAGTTPAYQHASQDLSEAVQLRGPSNVGYTPAFIQSLRDRATSNQLGGYRTNNPVAPATPGGSGQTPTT